MIALLPDLSDRFVSFLASRQVIAHDYESVVIPAIELALREQQSVRVLYQLGPPFFGFTPGAIGIFRFAIPCTLKVFSNAQYADAVEWITA
jgi:hypothetical protein